MQTKLVFEDAASSASPLLTVFALDQNTEKEGDPKIALLSVSAAVQSAAAAVLTSGEFKAGVAETLLLHNPAGLKAARLLIVGVGKTKSLSAVELRKAAGTAVRFAKPRGIREVAIIFPEGQDLAIEAARSAQAIVEGAVIADFDPDTYKSDRKDQSIAALSVFAPSGARAAIETGVAEGEIIASAQNFARSLVNEPGNKLTPTVLGQRAAEMARTSGLAADGYSTDKMKELGMGAFLGVAQGSYEPPALIVLTYTPPAAPAADAPVFGLVGKGITFDTGGISIKPADGMEKMKYDMAGAAAMLGAMQAVAALKPPFKVISVICSCENKPSGRSYKPGDILTSASGKTIEINNTDAEGRLVLADGLWYAKQLGATKLVNAATLTGACAVALGLINAGLFTNDEATSTAFTGAAKIAGEGFWALPSSDEYLQLMKSSIADLMNTSNTRWGGASTAAAFLKEFVGETPWIHLDIAGLAWQDADKPWMPKGPSGFAVRSIVEWVRSTQ
ncbi:MAG: leucyl aminopeptidase [Acidobacteriaceae bacterium]|nr:leucyl aminopeptidase [Acidobacteriaceae bacterium]